MRSLADRKRTVYFFILIPLLFCASCSRGSEKKPNVILLLVDTLRADHVGCYGYTRDTSPRLDELSRESSLFLDVTSQAPWTSPSVASLFTSLYPSTHHILTLKSGDRLRTLDEGITTLAEILKREGYATAAFTANPWLSPGVGIERGFDVYKNLPMTARALALNQRALEWLRGQAREPFFLYLHYMDVHGPYSPPAPYDTLFSLSGYARRELSDEEFGRMPPYLRIEGSRRLEDYIRRYDGEIRFWDDCLSAFLEALSEGRLLEKSIIIVTADHGEEFLDHGGFNHGSTLFQEQVKVPLVWRMPGPAKSGMRIESQVELVDVMPTLLSILEIRTDEVLQGDDLRTLMERGTWSPKPAFSEAAAAFGGVPLPEGTIKSVRWGTRKAILNIDTGRACLYDLTEDPGEREDRSGALSTDRHELLSLLAGWLEAASRAGESYGAGEEEAGEELLEKLRALGYIEG